MRRYSCCRSLLFLAGVGLLASATAAWSASAASPPTVAVQVDKPGAPISPMLFGVFFEDINFGADGGIYPELVKNRSFEFTDPMMGWRRLEGASQGSANVVGSQPINSNNPHFLRIKNEPGQGGCELVNEGFRGMGVSEGGAYTASYWGRVVDGGPFTVQLEVLRPDGKVIGRCALGEPGREWKNVSATLRTDATEPKARLRIVVKGQGTLDLDMVSLFPQDTWNKRPNGLRPDLVELLRELRPGFVRFPGGCIVEGRDLSNRYQWKTTIGDVAERRMIVNRWNNEFKHRPTPDYFQSFGLGFLEYFLLCEDIGASPLPILNCGMACQFNTGELVPLGQLDPYLQDALDLIEFANGPVTSRWGGRRAELGHPGPFNLTVLGVGNEQWGPQYVERYREFARVLKAKHPEVSLVASAGPGPADDKYRYLWSQWRDLKPDIVDEHCYDKPAWFYKNATRYDRFDRSGPRIFMGEYAAQSVQTCSPENRNNWECALAEAAFLTGLERNADLVVMSSYAPLSGHVDGWQWRPNLIWFDNLRSFGTPNYYVQQLFGANRGTHVLPVAVTAPGEEVSNWLFASASLDKYKDAVVLKLVNASPERRDVRISLPGNGAARKQGREVVLFSADLQAQNSLDEPRKVAPVERPLAVAPDKFLYTIWPYSLTVLRVSGE